MTRSIFVAVVFLVFPAALLAEKVNLTPDQLTKIATHVVVGNVKAIYERKTKDGNWDVTNYVAELEVTKSDKGDGVKKGDLVYVRYWNRRWVGKGDMPPSTNGHRDLPSAGDTVRVYLARNAYDGFSDKNNDGGYNVIGANGFEKVAK